MVKILQFPIAPWLRISERAWLDIGHIELAARKLPAMEADYRESKRVERTDYAKQLRSGFLLHDEIWKELASIATLESVTVPGKPGELSIASGYLVHRVAYRLIGDEIEIFGFSFHADAFAPPDFKIYPLLLNLSLVVDCPYQAANSL